MAQFPPKKPRKPYLGNKYGRKMTPAVERSLELEAQMESRVVPADVNGGEGALLMPMTAERKQVFLDEMAVHGVFSHAARVASPHSKRGCLSSFRLEATKDPKFAIQVEEARDVAKGAVLKEIHRRAVDGYDRPVFQRGEEVGHTTEYSDKLLELIFKIGNPDYAEKREVLTKGVLAVGNIGDLGSLSRESREDIRRILAREIPDGGSGESDTPEEEDEN